MKRLGDILLDQQARTRTAHLALVEPDGVDHAFDGAVQVGILEDDERRLAAQLQRELLAGAGRLAAQGAARHRSSR